MEESTESLVLSIQRGADRYEELWERVKGFVSRMARRRIILTEGRGGVTVDDLMQVGFIAMMEAAATFREEASFLTWLAVFLRKEFRTASGLTERQQRDPLNNATSLSTPIDEEGVELVTILPDERDDYEDAEHRIFTEQLRKVLDAALDDVPSVNASAIRRHYYNGMTLRQIAEADGVSVELVRQRIVKGLKRLKSMKVRNGLDQFLDEQTNYFKGVGLHTFNESGERPIEVKVLRRDQLARQYLGEAPGHPEP